MAWIKVSERLPEKQGKYKVMVDLDPLPMFDDIREIEVNYSMFNGNKIFHLPHSAQIREWWEEEN